jgi:hypothetical protein
MGAISRLGAEVACAGCGRANTLVLPEASCGNEFVWQVRCGTCGGWRWFHARQDASFVLAVRETARRRGEMAGLSPEGTREAHALFEATVPPCPCGGRFHVVRSVVEEPCLGCGARLGGPGDASPRRPVEVAPLRPPSTA